jgi:hypothetical protein
VQRRLPRETPTGHGHDASPHGAGQAAVMFRVELHGRTGRFETR